MYSRIICFLLVVQLYATLGKRRGEACTTPNNESARCIAIKDCKVILNAVVTRNFTAIKFARESQCGYDSTPLVCCGTIGYPTPQETSTTTSSYFSTFRPSSVLTHLDDDIILKNFNTNELPNRTVCGLETGAQRVHGGTITDLDEFPWMAALEYQSRLTRQNAGIRCGGSLINNRYILTAAHCIQDKEFELILVRLGEWNITSDPDCIEGVAISRCSSVLKLGIHVKIPHPFYSKSNNDIGLLQLENDVTFTDYIRPICLPRINLPDPSPGTIFMVVGWGVTETGLMSDVKLKVEVPLVANDVCNTNLTKSRADPISSNQLCAGGEQGKDSCQGDSGGPLMRTYQDSKTLQFQWYQEGVVSRGVGCARAGYPAIYTRVSRYVNWILNTMAEDT